tara:strand:- start:8235 stop:9101 length:867 start_codon:yes stop_codon:yes gene_type:complete
MNLLAICLLILMSFATQAKDVNDRRDAQPEGLVKIAVLRGEVEIEGWDRAEIEVKGELDELATDLRFEVKDGVTEIEVIMPRHNVNWADGSDLVIRVPFQSKVAVDAVSTDIVVEDVRGSLQLRTISGEIKMKGGRERMNLKTVSGDITTEDTVGRLQASSTSGDIDISNHEGDFDGESMSGEIDVVAKDVSRMRGSSVSGKVSVKVGFTTEARAELTSVSGKIVVRVMKPIDLSLQVDSNSGDIDNDLSDDKAFEMFGMKSLRSQIGKGSGTLTVRSVSGAIELEEG